jgi:chemotaxis protein MotB
MAEKRKQKAEEGPPGVPAWLVTFTDCMTLLLCFFVLLLTFSDFNRLTLRRLEGAFETLSYDAVFKFKQDPMNSLIPEIESPRVETAHGSAQPTDHQPEKISYPKPLPEIRESDAFRDRRTFYVPTDELFWGEGLTLREDSQGPLKLLAAFMKKIPQCHVVVGESRTVEQGEVSENSLARAWVLMKYFMDETGLSEDRFSLSAGESGAIRHFQSRGVMEITIRNRRVDE